MPPYGHNNATQGKHAWHVRESVRKPVGNTRNRVDFDPLAFDRLLEQKGVDVFVYRSTYCPNVKSVDSAEHNIDCTLCNGSGWLDRHPIKTRTLILNQDLEAHQLVEGIVDGNHVALTFPIGIELQYFTLVELVDFTDIYIQRLQRNVAATTYTDVLKYRALRVNLLMDRTGAEYYPDVDFKLDTNGNIQWLPAGNNPADNTPYSVHYEAKVQFRAVRAMHVNRFTQVKVGTEAEHLKLPEQWLMAKEFLVRRKDKYSGVDLAQGPYDAHVLLED